ncbi:SLBB domain-containing protein [Pelomonas sp. CA6]|uniref:SLBB domain-containing protein n=1 Tax=Pelomonas sp. CA6 TaxID=2907999 RepID=UPI001F4C1ABB|nr:SLBB domain-containing protein [Pelomonas sp. CA6]MCH7344432.1 SLBB domain-containing protein [Pelomonas sp. CA6]
MELRAQRALSPAAQENTTGRSRFTRHALAALAACLMVGSAMAQSSSGSSESGNDVSGPIRLAVPGRTAQDQSSQVQQAAMGKRERYVPGEFEIYVNRLQGIDLKDPEILELLKRAEQEQDNPYVVRPQQQSTSLTTRTITPDTVIHRLGYDLMLGDGRGLSDADGPRQAPADYLIGIGDELQLTAWGSIDADLRLTVDRSGRVTIPRVGPVLVAGIRYGDLNDVVRNRIGQVFKNFQVSTSLGKLRSIRIYVTGFTAKPGTYTVSSLATIANALTRAGGPSAAGSFRQIELRRNGRTVANFDAYDLLLKGDKSGDRALQAEDVIHIGAVGPQVAVLGSVNKPTIVELKPNETIDDVLAMAGGFNAVADRTRLSIERLSERSDKRIVEVTLPAQAKSGVMNGDVLRVFSSVNTALPQYKQYKRVTVEGEVAKPGEYVLPPSATLPDAIQAAGGLTPHAYVFGTDFSRESVRLSQQENYDRALRDMETELTKYSSTQRAATADEASANSQRASATERLVSRLRAVRPTGRVVLQLETNASRLPDLTIEDGDRLLIPNRPMTVGVFGSVFNSGSFLLKDGATVDDILKLAGGPTRGADSGATFVIRANGTVVSARQSSSGWLGYGNNLNSMQALPGDTVFVPEEMNKTTFIQEAKDWTQILYQFGLGAAALKTIKN